MDWRSALWLSCQARLHDGTFSSLTDGKVTLFVTLPEVRDCVTHRLCKSCLGPRVSRGCSLLKYARILSGAVSTTVPCLAQLKEGEPIGATGSNLALYWW